MNHRKEKPGKLASKSGLTPVQMRINYRFLDLLQAPFAYVFWLIEQRKALLQDRIDNRRHDQ